MGNSVIIDNKCLFLFVGIYKNIKIMYSKIIICKDSRRGLRSPRSTIVPYSISVVQKVTRFEFYRIGDFKTSTFLCFLFYSNFFLCEWSFCECWRLKEKINPEISTSIFYGSKVKLKIFLRCFLYSMFSIKKSLFY